MPRSSPIGVPGIIFVFLIIILFLAVIFYAWRGECGNVRSMFVCLSLAILLVLLFAAFVLMIVVGCIEGPCWGFCGFVGFILLLIIFCTLLWC